MKHLCIRSIAALCFLPGLAWAQANLENPQPGSLQSGIGVISGWVCQASRVDIAIDGGPPAQAAYGTSREDTRSVCGDANNGFGLLLNWNLAGDGTHTVQALADGVEFARVTFNVTTLGAEFLTGLAASSIVPDFPSSGLSTAVQWQQSLQNFVIGRVQVTTATARVADAPSVFRVIENNGFRYGKDLFGAGPSVLTLSSFTTSASSTLNAVAAVSVLRGSFVMMLDDGTMAAGQVDSTDRDGDGLADCNYTFTTSQFPQGKGPQVGDIIPCAVCDFRINSEGVAPGSVGLGWLEWDLDLVRNPTTIQNPALTSNSVPVQVRRDAAGNIIEVNGLPVVAGP